MKDDKEIVSKYKAILKNMDYGTNIEKTHGLTVGIILNPFFLLILKCFRIS